MHLHVIALLPFSLLGLELQPSSCDAAAAEARPAVPLQTLDCVLHWVLACQRCRGNVLCMLCCSHIVHTYRIDHITSAVMLSVHARAQVYESNVRHRQRAEEKAARAAEKAAKEEQKRMQDLKSYKAVMKVRRWQGGRVLLGCLCMWRRVVELWPPCKAACTARSSSSNSSSVNVRPHTVSTLPAAWPACAACLCPSQSPPSLAAPHCPRAPGGEHGQQC